MAEKISQAVNERHEIGHNSFGKSLENEYDGNLSNGDAVYSYNESVIEPDKIDTVLI